MYGRGCCIVNRVTFAQESSGQLPMRITQRRRLGAWSSRTPSAIVEGPDHDVRSRSVRLFQASIDSHSQNWFHFGLVCVLTSKSQSRPLKSLLMSSKGVATKVRCMFVPLRLWPLRAELAPFLETPRTVDAGLEGNTCVQLSFRLKVGGAVPESRVAFDEDVVDDIGSFRIFIDSAMTYGIEFYSKCSVVSLMNSKCVLLDVSQQSTTRSRLEEGGWNFEVQHDLRKEKLTTEATKIV
jgi:hypothetical protein